MSADKVRAIVTSEPLDGQLNWKMENVSVRDIGPDELLVRVVASGICHTDAVFSVWPAALIPYPKVLGHEGAGVVLKAGSNVKKAAVGDKVLLSFHHCDACHNCEAGRLSYCDKFAEINYGGEGDVYSLDDNNTQRGSFFGQSSFSERAVVKEASVVNVSSLVNSEEELKIFAPMGCGFQTGAGAIENVANAGENDAVVVFGLGGVGLSAIMAAKWKKCKFIIGIDLQSERVELAKALGATHGISTLNNDCDLREEIKSITGGRGASVTIDTTGSLDLIRAGMDFTASKGQLIFIGVPPPDAMLDVHVITFLQTGKSIRGCIEGDAIPDEYIPKMIKMYRDGHFPIDKLIKTYPANDFQQALVDMKKGTTIKPVLTW